jgi:biotin carboxylase
MKILLTEGASLTSRQVATRLDQLGHEVWVATSDPWCMARFTRHVRHRLVVPPFGNDPLAWFDQMLDGARDVGIEVVFPTQEQVAVLAHQLPRLEAAGLRTAVPSFGALARMQDKVAARRTLEELGVPQPPTAVVRDTDELTAWTTFPAYVKAPLGTGSTGVRRVCCTDELVDAVLAFLAAGALREGGVLVQGALDGTFVMAQCVFDAGHLVAFHANERVVEGAHGSGAVKRSVLVPQLAADLAGVGQTLDWHGALSVDAIVAGDTAFVIDVNPRLVEPGNALAAGTDMVSALLAVACGQSLGTLAPSRQDARTHQLLMAILGAAQHSGRRRAVARVLVDGLGHRAKFAGSIEELQPLAGDWRAALIPAAAAVATLVRPATYAFFTDGAVSRYALSPEGWRQLGTTVPLPRLTPTPT